MKFTVIFTTLLCMTTTWAITAKEEPKDKRETLVGYGSHSLHSSNVHGSPGHHGPSGLLTSSASPHSSVSLQSLSGHSPHSYQPQTYSQGDANAISVGAGYSIGGGKPSYSFGGQEASAPQEYGGQSFSPNGHGTIQLAPITLQSNQGAFSAGDLSQIMSQLQQSLGGAVQLQPSNTIAEFHQGQGAEGLQGGQEYSFSQFTYGTPKVQQYTVNPEQLQSAPAYSSGTKGLGSYSTGPVLFTPEQHSNSPQSVPTVTYGTPAPSAGHSYADAGSLSHGGAGHSLAGFNLGGAGHSFGGSYKQLSGGYAAPGKASFKPSTFIGSSVQGDSGHGLSSLSPSYSAPSFGGYRGGHSGLSLSSAGHGGASFGGSLGGFGSGSTKYLAPVYQSAKPEGLEAASAFSSGHIASPPSTTYGFPSTSYTTNTVHAASSNRPFYITKQQASAYRSPIASPSAFSSYSSGPKYSFGTPSSHYAPKDAHVSASETVYNTIKYSEELAPHVH